MEEDQGKQFLVMELVQGEGRVQRMDRGPIAPDEALSITLQIARGLIVVRQKAGTGTVTDLRLEQGWFEEVRELLPVR